MGAGLISGISGFLGRTAERVDAEKERKRKEKEVEKQDRITALDLLLDNEATDPGVREWAARERMTVTGVKPPDLEQQWSLETMGPAVDQGALAPPPSLMAGPGAQPTQIPSPQQAQAAQQAPIQPGAADQPPSQAPAMEALAPPPPLVGQGGQPTDQAPPAEAMQPPMAQSQALPPPPPIDPDVMAQAQLKDEYTAAGEEAAPTQVDVQAQDPMAEIRRLSQPEPGRMFTSPERQLERQLATEDIKEGRKQARALEGKAAEFELGRQQRQQITEDDLAQVEQALGRPLNERETLAAMGFDKLLQKDPNIMEANAVSGDSLLAAGVETLMMGDQEIPVQSGQQYKIQQVPGEKTSGLPTQAQSPYEGEFTLREGKASVRYGFNTNTGKVEEIVRGRPIESTAASATSTITMSPAFASLVANPGVKPIVAPIAAKLKESYGTKGVTEAAVAAVLNGTPVLSSKVTDQMSKLNTANFLMTEAFNAAARIQGFASADAMLAEADVPENVRQAFLRSATLKNLSESGKSYVASFTGLPDAQKVEALAGALRFLLPRGWGEVGNLAQQESESALKLAANIGDSVPRLVANWDTWTTLQGSIKGQVKSEGMTDIDRARQQMLDLGLVDASMFKGGSPQAPSQPSQGEGRVVRNKRDGKLYRLTPGQVPQLVEEGKE